MGSLLATALPASALSYCPNPMATSAGKNWGKGEPGKERHPGSCTSAPTLTHSYLHDCYLYPMSINPHLPPGFDLAPTSHLIFGEVQDLNFGGFLYNVRQTIQLVQFVAAQVQGQQLWGKKS